VPNDGGKQTYEGAAQRIADVLRGIVDSEERQARVGYHHMGATLSDAILQAGLNYRTVVLPRVTQILASYPDADTTTKFQRLLSDVGPNKVLRWSHPEKINRLMDLVGLLYERNLETEPQLAMWLWSASAAAELRAIKGIGPKTIDYLKILVGLPAVAVDRHILSLFRLAGLQFTRYDAVASVFCMAAEILHVQPQVLDGIVWENFSKQARPRLLEAAGSC
jgi:hypothetical protein